jgi:hypothetical protein
MGKDTVVSGRRVRDAVVIATILILGSLPARLHFLPDVALNAEELYAAAIVSGPDEPRLMLNAVAPNDTVVPTDTSRIILDYTRSTYAAGEAVSFLWTVDDTLGIEGGPITSITLPVGIHTVELLAVDQFDNEDRDTMMVTVLYPSGVDENGPSRGTDRGHGTLKLELEGAVRVGQTLHITYEAPSREYVSLRVYDIQGRLVRTLSEGELGPGIHRALWDLNDLRGEPVKPATYLCSIIAGRRLVTRKVAVVR